MGIEPMQGNHARSVVYSHFGLVFHILADSSNLEVNDVIPVDRRSDGRVWSVDEVSETLMRDGDALRVAKQPRITTVRTNSSSSTRDIDTIDNLRGVSVVERLSSHKGTDLVICE